MGKGVLLLATLLLAACGGVAPTYNTGGAANATAAQGLGEGPIGEVPNNGGFGPDSLSPSR